MVDAEATMASLKTTGTEWAGIRCDNYPLKGNVYTKDVQVLRIARKYPSKRRLLFVGQLRTMVQNNQ